MNCKRKLGPTDIKYKIICAGSGFDVGCGKQVIVICNGKTYNAKMHSKTKGRIDGLSQLYIDFNLEEGQEIELTYNDIFNVVSISTLNKIEYNVNCAEPYDNVIVDFLFPNIKPEIIDGFYIREERPLSEGIRYFYLFQENQKNEILKIKIDDKDLQNVKINKVKQNNFVKIQCNVETKGDTYFLVCYLKQKVIKIIAAEKNKEKFNYIFPLSEEWKKFKFESFETLFEKKKQKEEKNSQIVSKETKEMKNSEDILKNINVVFGEVGSIDKTKNKINSGRFKYDKTYEAVHKKLGFIDDYAEVWEDMWVLYVIDSKTNKKYRVHESYVRFDVVKIDNEKGHIFIEFEYGFNPNKIWCLDIFTSKVIDYNAKN